MPPLPDADRELDALAAIAGARRTVRLTGARATLPALETAAAAGRYASVHFATHGLFNEKRPQYSGLILSPDPAGGDDGFVTVSEVFGLALDCDQVVLSACSTALGEEVTGEGVVGLTRAFLFAGAQRVVAALWEVAGSETADLMELYYEHLAEGQDAALALSLAKRDLAAGKGTGGGPRPHPYFWSPFVLVGAER
jgi:CHAT domain-containing protein